MNVIKNVKSPKIKLTTSPKLTKKIIHNNKSKGELRPKINYIIKEKDKNLLIKVDQNDNLVPLESINNPENNYALQYESNSNNDKNNNLPNEKSTKTDDSSGEEKVKRKIQVQTPLNLRDKFKNSNNISNKKNKITLSLSLMNYISNKPTDNNNISKLIKENNDSKNEIKNNDIKKAIYYKDYNINKKIKNYLNKKSLTENNFINNNNNRDIINSDKNLYTKNYKNNTENNTKKKNNKIFIKNKSFNCLKRITLNNIDKGKENQDIAKINKDTNKSFHYIKVNKKKINNDMANTNINDINEIETININKLTQDIIDSIINKNIKKDKIARNKNIKNKINNKNKKNDKNKFYNTEIAKKSKVRILSFKKIEKENNKYNSNIPINKNEQIYNKPINNFDKNKLEHNIFLDKTYQNRFKKKPKNNNKTQNDIFTSDKQKEYNNFIVKKKSNYLSNQLINSNNSSISSNESNKDWVYRLYNQEIKKQKIKDKIILLLRKSILNEGKNQKKKLEKSKTVKEFKNYEYPINEGYNIDDNFNIINLFLSEEKKMKKKKMDIKKKKIKKCQSFHTYRNKQQRKYNLDNNKIEDEKIGKLIEDKIRIKNHRSFKKFRLLYNEELIDEEDEEKEKDEEDQ